MYKVVRELRLEGSYYFHKTPLPELDYSINPYFGCEFGCRYCYSMRYFKLRGIKYKWGEYVEAKIYLPRVLTKVLNRFEEGSVIGIGTYSDPYMPWEAKLRLTRRILEILSRRRDLRISIQTKSPLVLRDLDLLTNMNADIGFSISSLDPRYISYFEPYAPRPKSRFKALEKLSKSLETWVFIAPIMPYINDDESELDEILKYSVKSHVDYVYSDVIRFRLGVRESIINILKEYNPSLINYYRHLERPEIFKRYRLTVDYLRKRSKEYGLKYIDAAEMMWDYIK